MSTTKLPQVVGAAPEPRIGLTGYAADRIFSAVEIDLLGWAESYMAKVPSRQPDGDWVRCHEVARAVGRLLGAEVADGKYGPVEHSWLELLDPTVSGYCRHILDVYVPGRLPRVQLIDAWLLLPEGTSYQRGEARDDIRYDIIAWLLMLMEQ